MGGTAAGYWKYHFANYGQMNLMNELRKLWTEHMFWTRLFLISMLSGLSDLEVTTNRLLRNPTDFAKVLEVFYGKQKAETFRSMLEDHLKIAAAIVDNSMKGNGKAVEQYSRLWYSNADRIAAFLASINPCWSEEEWKSLLYEHLKMTGDELAARMNGDFVEDGKIFDMIENQGLAMADVMAAGMINQFDI